MKQFSGLNSILDILNCQLFKQIYFFLSLIIICQKIPENQTVHLTYLKGTFSKFVMTSSKKVLLWIKIFIINRLPNYDFQNELHHTFKINIFFKYGDER